MAREKYSFVYFFNQNYIKFNLTVKNIINIIFFKIYSFFFDQLEDFLIIVIKMLFNAHSIPLFDSPIAKM